MNWRIIIYGLIGDEVQIAVANSVTMALHDAYLLARAYAPIGCKILIRDEDGRIVFDSDFHEVYLDGGKNLQMRAKKKARIEA